MLLLQHDLLDTTFPYSGEKGELLPHWPQVPDQGVCRVVIAWSRYLPEFVPIRLQVLPTSPRAGFSVAWDVLQLISLSSRPSSCIGPRFREPNSQI